MHYIDQSNVTSSFRGIWYGLWFLATLFFSLSPSIGKRSIPWFLRACRIYIILHIRKHRFIHFCCVLLRSLKAFGLSLIQLLWELLINVISQGSNQSTGTLNVNWTSTEHCILTRKRNHSMLLNLTVKNFNNFQLK